VRIFKHPQNKSLRLNTNGVLNMATKFDLDRPEMSGGPVFINQDNFKVLDLADDIRKQSSLFQYYGKLAINAKREASQAKLRLKQATGEKELALREKADEKGKKYTENHIKALLAVDPDLIALENELIDAEAVAGLLDTAKWAMDHKKSMIDDAVRLEVSGGFNGNFTNALADEARLNIRKKV